MACWRSRAVQRASSQGCSRTGETSTTLPGVHELSTHSPASALVRTTMRQAGGSAVPAEITRRRHSTRVGGRARPRPRGPPSGRRRGAARGPRRARASRRPRRRGRAPFRPGVRSGHAGRRETDVGPHGLAGPLRHLPGDLRVDGAACVEQCGVDPQQGRLEVRRVRRDTTAQHGRRTGDRDQAGCDEPSGQRLGDGERPALRRRRGQEAGRVARVRRARVRHGALSPGRPSWPHATRRGAGASPGRRTRRP